MRLGLRLQLLLALGSLLVLAFVALFFASASLTRASMTQGREASARALGRAIAGHVIEARATRRADELGPLLDAQLGNEGVAAIAIYDAAGASVARAGDPDATAGLPEKAAPGLEETRTLRTARGPALLVVVPSPRPTEGPVAALVRTDPSTVASAPLVRLFALYTGIVAFGLLVFAYLSMTRLVVRPVVSLSDAARRVADGARRFEVPAAGAAELADLGASLRLMTERLRADEEALREKVTALERATADLESAQERLVRSERLASVGRLAAGLAHEIGNPIAAILGFQDLLLDGGLDDKEAKDFLERMKRETERVHRILRDLLDFARPATRGAGDEDTVAGSVSDAIDDVVALVTPQKEFRSLELTRDVAPSLPAVALSHERIVQVLLNLLLNAGDAVPKTGGRVVIRAARRGDRAVRLEVEDNGRGIAPEIQARLFEPFVTTKEVGKGTGLGLAVCRGLVEAAGGTIGVEKGSEGGARFVLDLPAAPDAG